jgi:hypothetical protein
MKTSTLLQSSLFLLLSPLLLSTSFLYFYAITSADMTHLLPSGPYSGDNVIPDAVMIYDQTKLIRAPPEAVWPWVLQVGKGRGGCK